MRPVLSLPPLRPVPLATGGVEAAFCTCAQACEAKNKTLLVKTLLVKTLLVSKGMIRLVNIDCI
jgi:hypothetical protein